MKLRHPLLLMSLLTLSLPWAGCKYIQQVEDTLRQGQGLGISSTAQAVAARIESEPALLRSSLTHSLAPYPPPEHAEPFYAHYLPKAPTLLDGYEDDWQPWGFEKKRFEDKEREQWALEMMGGIHNDHLYLFLKIDDNDIQYHNPTQHQLASGDYILLTGLRGDSFTQYVIATSAPGSITARYTNSQQQIQSEYRIKGILREHYRGYQLELKVPLSLVSDGFGLSAIDRRKTGEKTNSLHHSLGTTTPLTPGAAPLILPMPHLERTLNVFERPGLQLRIVDPKGWLLANGSEPMAPPAPKDHTPWVIEWVYKNALANEPLLERGLPENSGHWNFIEVSEAAEGSTSIQWYQQGERRLGSAAVPIWVNGEVAAIVLAEQSINQLQLLTNSAFNQLLSISLSAALLWGTSLILYASWLSWRVRRLSTAAEQMTSEDGQLQTIPERWPLLRAKDELGDLSRSYHTLLIRLHEYTDYLKSLASKLSHELRTPLAVVRSSLDNLNHEPLDTSAKTYSERAVAGVDRLSAILTAMSEASRVETSISSAEVEAFPLNELVTQVVESYKDVYLNHQLISTIKPEKFAEDHQHFEFRGAPDLLVQMLDKLVDNASDFCPPQGKIEVCLQDLDHHFQLSVTNEGPLLPEQMQGQLFDSLVSIREKRSDKAHLGLGLHIVRLIVSFHNGQVGAENLEDKSGVRFIITLPKSTIKSAI